MRFNGTYLVGLGELEEVEPVGVPLVDDVSQGLSLEGPAIARRAADHLGAL